MDQNISSILKNCTPTYKPFIFENIKPLIQGGKATLIVLTGPTGSGKTTFLKILSKMLNRVKTATSRKEMREDENEDSFLWIKEEKIAGESDDEFKLRIQEKYDLLETNIHAGNIYGTPRSEIENALVKGDAIISVENNGARAMQAKLAHQTNLITFFVLPDSIEELRKRVGITRNDIEQRMEVARKEIETSSEFTNYYIHNTELNIYSGEESPLIFTERNLVEFISKLLDISH